MKFIFHWLLQALREMKKEVEEEIKEIARETINVSWNDYEYRTVISLELMPFGEIDTDFDLWVFFGIISW